MAPEKPADTVFLVPEAQAEPDHYLVSHSSNAVLLDPQGAVYAVFTPPRVPAQLATDLAAVVRHHARRDGWPARPKRAP